MRSSLKRLYTKSRAHHCMPSPPQTALLFFIEFFTRRNMHVQLLLHSGDEQTESLKDEVIFLRSQLTGDRGWVWTQMCWTLKLTVSITILHPPETRKSARDRTRDQVTGPCSVRRVSGTPRCWILELTLVSTPVQLMWVLRVSWRTSWLSHSLQHCSYFHSFGAYSEC